MADEMKIDPKLLNRLESLRQKISDEHQTQNTGEENYNKKVDELLDHLIKVARNISRRRYGDPAEIFELTKTGIYPERIYELAESFGMMIVKVEARELRLEQTIAKLQELNAHLEAEIDARIKIEKELQVYRDNLESLIAERTEELLKTNELLQTEILERRKIDEERVKLIEDLQNALDNIKTLKGLIPICSSCKNIRDDQGYWHDLEVYLSKHSDIEFSHSLCPDCMQKYYPEEYKRLLQKGKLILPPEE